MSDPDQSSTDTNNENESALTQRVLCMEDYRALANAVQTLEDPSLAARLANLVGLPIESILKSLPKAASDTIGKASEIALRKTLDVALLTMRKGQRPASRGMHKLAATASGAVGGATGFAGLAIELPITTGIIFRSIADLARAEGEDLTDPRALIACMEVFALGGPRKSDDAGESGYFTSRVALAKAVQEATKCLAKSAASAEAPLLVRFITKLASRFGVVVSYKTAAQFAPIVGALGGATINILFVDHYQDMAQGHFTVRRLERAYGKDFVKGAYLSILNNQEDPRYLPVDDPRFEVIPVRVSKRDPEEPQAAETDPQAAEETIKRLSELSPDTGAVQDSE